MTLDYDYVSIEGKFIKQKKTYSGHQWKCLKHSAWPVYCSSCGHVRLNNEISRKASKKGCEKIIDMVVG